jgi:hypothetical protein
MIVAFSTLPGAGAVILAVLFRNGSEEDAKKYYKTLFDMEPIVNRSGAMPYEKVNGMLND